MKSAFTQVLPQLVNLCSFNDNSLKSLSVKARCAATTAMLLVATTITAPAYAEQPVSKAPGEIAVIKRAPPVYPEYAIKHGLEGSVLVNYSIEADGNTSDIQVVASDHDGLFDATAVLGVQKWLYVQPNEKIRNNYVAIEFVLTDQSKVHKYDRVERIRIKPNQ